MQSNELRLGNLVTIDNEKYWAKLKNMPLKVIAITQMPQLDGSTNGVSLEHINQIPNTFYETYSQFIHFIKPIQINEAWLKSFGFQETYNSQFRLKFDHSVNFIGFDFSKNEDKSMEGFRYYGHYMKIKYVHELQNLVYALTGEELSLSGI